MSASPRRTAWRLFMSLALILSLTATPLAWAESAGSGQAGSPEYVPGRVLVGFKPGTPAKSMIAAHVAAGAQTEGRIKQIGVDIMRVPKGRTVEGLIKMYEKNPNVLYAEPDYVVYAALAPNDPTFWLQWGHEYSNTPAAWDVTTGSPNVTIAILDTGIDGSHPEISARMLPGYDFINNDSDPADDHGHGTRVAGIATATGNNGIGVAGMDWQARILPVKVLSSSGSGSTSTVAQGMSYAADRGARVLNLSLGGSGSSTMQSAVRYAYDRGCVLVAASGNEGSGTPIYPAGYPEVIAVGSVSYDVLSSFSNYGPHMDVVAPGVGIETIAPGGAYGRFAGTSAATPFVAGLACLLFAVSPTATPADVVAAITASARDLGAPGWDQYYGWGHIDAAAALAAVGASIPAAPEPVAPPAKDPAPEPEPEPVADPQPEPTTPVDTIAPVVSISSPADGSTVSGLVTIRAEAGDDVGIVRVEFYVNGALQGTSTSPGYSTNWNTKRLSGEYTLTAVAYDAAGNTGTSSPVTVTVGTATKAPPGKKK